LRRYQDMGVPVYLRQLSRDHLHRVWIGPFATKSDAEAQLYSVRRISENAYICNRE
jgi:cell division septation protein DedD